MSEATNERSPIAGLDRERMLRALYAGGILCALAFALVHLVYLLASPGVPPSERSIALVLGFVAGTLAADFVSGLVHWACDTWGSEETPWLGPGLIKGFRDHHRQPRAMLDHDWVDVNRQATIASGVAFALLLTPTFQAALASRPFAYAGLWCFIAVSAVANQLHKWAHTGRPPTVVAALQRRGLVLSLRSHALHHRAPHTDGYCIATGWSNALLDGIGFWRGLERVVTFVSGARPRADEVRRIGRPVRRQARGRSAHRDRVEAEAGSRE